MARRLSPYPLLAHSRLPSLGLVTFRTRHCADAAVFAWRPDGRHRPNGPNFGQPVPIRSQSRQELRRLPAEQRVRASRVGPAGAACGPPSPAPTRAAAGRGGSGRSGRAGSAASSGPSRENARAGVGLVEAADGGGDVRVGVVRGEPGGGGELPLGGDRPAEPLQRDAVQELRVRPAVRGARAQGGELLRRAAARGSASGGGNDGTKSGSPGANCGWRRSSGADRVGRVRLVARGGAPGGEGARRSGAPSSSASPRWSRTSALRGCAAASVSSRSIDRRRATRRTRRRPGPRASGSGRRSRRPASRACRRRGAARG